MHLRASFILALFAFADHSFAGVLFGPVTNSANSHVYFLLSSNIWSTAEIEARGLGGHLATVRSASEQSFIYSTFSHWAGTNRNLWIGLYDPGVSTNSADRTQRRAEFQWISGEPVTYSNWSSVEPNNSLSIDASVPELYCHIWNPTDPFASFWNNYTNTASEFGIEIDGVAEILPPVSPLQITRLSSGQVQLSWFAQTNKSYEILACSNLLAPMPTNLVTVTGSDGTISHSPDTQTLLNRGWTNFSALIPGDNALHTLSDSTDPSQRFYRLISFP